MLKFKIQGVPIAQKRPRFARRGKFVTTYSDQATEAGKTLLLIKEQMGTNKIITGAVSVQAVFYMPRPKGHFGTGRNAGKLKSSAPAYHTKKPDVDNLLKFYLDVMTDLVWHDDSQVVAVSGEKEYCSFGNPPYTEIDVCEIFSAGK